MKTLSFVQSKGGSGKSTVLCALAQLLAFQNKPILVLDTDPQKTAYQWAKKETSLSDYAFFDTSLNQPTLGKTLHVIQEKNYAYTFIDTAGFENRTNIFAIAKSDTVIVPVQESAPDMEGALKIIALIKEVMDTQNHTIQYGIIFNNVNPQTTSYESALNYFTEKHIPVWGNLKSLIGFKEMHTLGGLSNERAHAESITLLKTLQNQKIL